MAQQPTKPHHESALHEREVAEGFAQSFRSDGMSSTQLPTRLGHNMKTVNRERLSTLSFQKDTRTFRSFTVSLENNSLDYSWILVQPRV